MASCQGLGHRAETNMVGADSARGDALGKGQLPSALPLSSVLEKIKHRAAAAAAAAAATRFAAPTLHATATRRSNGQIRACYVWIMCRTEWHFPWSWFAHGLGFASHMPKCDRPQPGSDISYCG